MITQFANFIEEPNIENATFSGMFGWSSYELSTHLHKKICKSTTLQNKMDVLRDNYKDLKRWNEELLSIRMKNITNIEEVRIIKNAYDDANTQLSHRFDMRFRDLDNELASLHSTNIFNNSHIMY